MQTDIEERRGRLKKKLLNVIKNDTISLPPKETQLDVVTGEGGPCVSRLESYANVDYDLLLLGSPMLDKSSLKTD